MNAVVYNTVVDFLQYDGMGQPNFALRWEYCIQLVKKKKSSGMAQLSYICILEAPTGPQLPRRPAVSVVSRARERQIKHNRFPVSYGSHQQGERSGF
jgi:hypothetical protein